MKKSRNGYKTDILDIIIAQYDSRTSDFFSLEAGGWIQ